MLQIRCRDQARLRNFFAEGRWAAARTLDSAAGLDSEEQARILDPVRDGFEGAAREYPADTLSP